MAKTKISEYSSTSANNTDISNINIAEGCSPANVNNAIRTIMAQLKDQQDGTSGDPFTVGGNLTVTGTSTLTGNVTAPTQTSSDNSTKVATTAFVTTKVSTLGTMSTQNATSVAITGGTITGITDLTVADGGTGASSITANSVVLGNGTSALSGNLVAPGTSGNVLKSNGTTWQSTAAAGMGTFGSRNFGTTYTASTDGFFVANATNGGAVYGGFTMTVAGTVVVQSRSPSEGANGWQTGMFPIKSGQTYRADLTGGGASALSAFFIPFGN
jgi:hypothetical protein